MDNIQKISSHLILIKPCIPFEFARKPRSLNDIDQWKATELRQFLLYTGIVIMKLLSPVMYQHFLCLTISIAIRILIDPHLCMKFNSYANSLLSWFVSHYGELYDDKYISYNVHNLLHLANDVQSFGSLDNISCFKYENYMQQIKRKLHKCGKPLQELSNRVSEELQLPIKQCNIMQYPIAIYKKNKICYLQFKTFKISIKKFDNCVLLDDNSLAFVLDISEDNHVLSIRVQRILQTQFFFTIPCDSKKLDIFFIRNSSTSDIIQVPATRIKRKCLKLKQLDEVDSYVVIPLLHANN